MIIKKSALTTHHSSLIGPLSLTRAMIPNMILAMLLTCLVSLSVVAQESQTQPDVADAAPQKTVFPEQLPKHFPTLQAMSVRAFTEANYSEVERILKQALTLRPYDSAIMSQLVATYALQTERAKAYNLMLAMQQQGLAFDFNQIPQTESIRDTESYTYINNLLIKASDPLVSSQSAFRLPRGAVLPEAIAWDEKTERFVIGTVRDASIMLLDENGQPIDSAPEFVSDKRMAVFDIVIDSERRHLWASTTAVGQQSGFKQSDYGKNSLLKFNLDSGELIKEYHIKPDGQPHGLGNLALSSDGTVFVADLRSPLVYMLTPGSDILTVLAGGGALPNIRGIALDEENKLLYLADKNRGLAFIDLNDLKPYLLTVPEKLNLGGIEGLDYWNGHLLIIQPGMRPNRVMQLLLSDNGKAVVSAVALDANHPDYHAPNYGVVVGDEYYYMAASHWTAFDLNGNRLPGSSLEPVPVLKLALEPVDPAANQPPGLEDVLRQREEQQRNTPPPLLARPKPDDGQSR